MESTRKKHPFNSSIRQRLVVLRALDNWHCLIALVYDYAIIALAGFLFIMQPWCYPISAILIGSRQRTLATLLHESAHRCLAKSPSLNRFVGTYLSGYLIFQEYNIYVDTHVKQHHGFLGEKSRDPDLIYHQEQGLYQPMNKNTFLNQFVLKPLLLLKAPSYFMYLVKNRLNPNKKYRKQFVAMMSYWTVIVAIAAYYHLLTDLILLWFVPLVSTAAVFGWFNELAEHYPLTPEKVLDIDMSRNRFSHWFEHFLFNTHNEHLHLVHHLCPNIPFWNLKKAHAVLSEDPEYAKRNLSAGGIFISKNKNPSLIRTFLTDMSSPVVVTSSHD